jgi:hypothetical protein
MSPVSLDTGPPEKAAPRLVIPGRRKVSIDWTTANSYTSAAQPSSADIRRMRREYRLLCQLLAPLEKIFWELEQRRASMADRLANEGVCRRFVCPAHCR